MVVIFVLLDITLHTPERRIYSSTHMDQFWKGRSQGEDIFPPNCFSLSFTHVCFVELIHTYILWEKGVKPPPKKKRVKLISPLENKVPDLK